MAHIPDSGEPGNIFDELNLGPRKPELLSEATWQHINQRFQLRGELGAGGQAVVFEAKERNAPHRRVAIKVYHESTDAAHRAFHNEARILASDRLPTEVVGYYECVTEEGIQNHIVLEFIDGRTLAWLGRTKREFSLSQKLQLIESLARAFHQLHSCNLVFGDASANNILVEAEGSIRFVDLAGAKELVKGHGRTRSSINLVTPGFVPQTAEDSVAAKAVRTNLATDIYALAANAFLILTGRSEADVRSGESSRDATRLWEHALAQSQVPRGIRAIVLKGLRVPDERIDVDHRVYSTAESFADDLTAWKKRQKQKRSAVVFGLPTLISVAVLAVVAWTGWQKYESERAARAVRILEELSRQVELLPNATAPGVAELIAAGRAPLPSEAERTVADVQTRIDALRRAQVVSHDLQWAEPLRESLGDVLNQSPWLTSAKAISQRRDKLARDFLKLKDDMEAGLTDDLQPRLAQLHQFLAELARENTQAVPAEQARIDYDRLAESISERLQAEEVFLEIDRNADDSLRQLDAGDWNDARLQFGSCTQRLKDWLKKNETEDERAARHADNQDRVKELALEKEQLLADVERVNKLVAARDAELANLNASRSQLGTDSSTARLAREKALAELKAAQEAIAAEAMQRKSAEQQVISLRSDVERLTAQLAVLGQKTPKWLSTGLVAYYPLDGNANDASGNMHHGELKGVTFARNREGTESSSADFSSESHVLLPQMRYGSEFTVSLWMKTAKQTQIIFTKKPQDYLDSVQIVLAEGRVRASVSSADDVWIGRVSSAIRNDGDRWQLLTVSYDGGTQPSALRIYLDGQRVDSESEEKGRFTRFNDLNVPSQLGAQNSGPGNFEGQLDDVRLYGRSLSAEEVAELYEYESQPASNPVRHASLSLNVPSWLNEGLVAYYPLNGTAKDASGNGNDGTDLSAKVATGPRGRANGALTFANADAVIAPSRDYLNLTSPSGFTISFWAKRDGKCDFSHILNKADGPGPAKKWSVILGDYDVPRESPGKPYLGFHWPAGLSPQWAISDPIDWDTRWHSYAITKSGDTFTFYMDGTAIGSTKNASPLLNNAGPLRIGKSQEGEPAFNGSVSDVRIYSRRLSRKEVEELYELESGEPASVSSSTLTNQPPLDDVAAAEKSENAVFLDDLPVESFRVKQGFQLGLRGKGGWEPDGPVIFNGSPVAHAVSMHARRGPGTFPSVAVFNLGGEYVRFKAQACFSGSPTEKALRGRTSFRVFASWNGEKLNHNPPHGGKELWASPTASDLSDVFDVDVDITEATQLMLVVDETSDDDSMSTVWMSPKLFRKSSL